MGHQSGQDMEAHPDGELMTEEELAAFVERVRAEGRAAYEPQALIDLCYPLAPSNDARTIVDMVSDALVAARAEGRAEAERVCEEYSLLNQAKATKLREGGFDPSPALARCDGADNCRARIRALATSPATPADTRAPVQGEVPLSPESRRMLDEGMQAVRDGNVMPLDPARLVEGEVWTRSEVEAVAEAVRSKAQDMCRLPISGERTHLSREVDAIDLAAILDDVREKREVR